ncbi:hypothetical protein EGR_04759 [Echinococcus granulosus]|uniref:Uncharacterized protein n=1 Tax=Echinococcus granulosus TaxID=6210 RepID=W6UQ06_ECHGR|nr:hypothetical protein EGR_04759 [Echinococcus granulosus]EUB60377.1 hypothetical protein EGR_04759 [Echinococcus granulosus]
MATDDYTFIFELFEGNIDALPGGNLAIHPWLMETWSLPRTTAVNPTNAFTTVAAEAGATLVRAHRTTRENADICGHWKGRDRGAFKKSSRISVSPQHNFREFRRSVSTGFQSGNNSANERGGSGGSPSARTRRARCRTQVLHSSSSHLMTRQVVTVLRQVGLRPRVVAEGLLTVTWPTETNLDRLERQEPLSMEMHIYRDQGMKFRRLSGPESLFRWKLQKVLSLVYAQCGW